MRSYLGAFAAVVLALGVVPANTRAQSNQPADRPVELQQGVARVSFIHGDVSSQHGENGEWSAVTLNTPVVAGDRVSTGQKSRAELQLDWADILRMADSATANVVTLDRTHIQVQVGQGLVTYNVLKGSEADSEIQTPNASVHPVEPGEYRILVNSDAETQVIVRKGAAEISEPQGTTRVEQGQMVTVAGTDNPEYKTERAPGKDDWDAWNNDRDHKISNAESWRKTDRYYTGSEDLDAYGRWTEAPDYGPVWVPAEGPGWAPYRDGRWIWEPYYGWTWVSYEPWGWAPYHYGRWFVYGGDWVWWPGPVFYDPFYYPVWAPAYVSFFGFGGGGWGVGFGFGFGGWNRIGWLPCGPGDWYHPWYGRWGNRVNVYNVTNIRNTTIINNNFHDGFGPLAGKRGQRYSNFDRAFSDPRVRGGMSSMAGKEFGRAAVPSRQQPISGASFRQASMMTGKMPVSPSRESYSPSGRLANASAIRNVPPTSQHFFNPGSRMDRATNAQGSRTFGNPNAANRSESSFGGGRSLGQSERPSSQPFSRTPTQPVEAGRGPAQGRVQSARPGWRPFTTPLSAQANRQEQPAGNAGRPVSNGTSQSARPGWRPFTPPLSAQANRQEQPAGNTARPMSNGSAGTRFNSSAAQGPQNRGAEQPSRNGGQRFTPPSQSSQPQGAGRGFAQPGAQQREFHAPTSESRGGYSRSYSRPPLNMRQPIVTPRNNGAYNRGPYGGGSNGGYSAPRGGYSAPRGGYSAPRGGYSAPRGGGGNGGGGRSGGGRSGSGRSGGGRSR